MDQNNGEIFTQGRRATADLEKLSVWQGSSAQFFVHAPSGVSSLQFVVGANAIDAEYDVAKKCWRVYCHPNNLATAGEYRYAVKALDEYGNTTILGEGDLIVKSALSSGRQDGGSGAGSTGSKDDCYIRNPDTGLWHKVTATVEDGEIVLQYDKEGVER